LVEKGNGPVSGNAFVKIFGQEVRFLSLSSRSIKQMLKESLANPTDLLRLTQGRLPVDFRKALMAAEASVTIPTELGLPLTVQLFAPVVASVKGTLGLKTSPALSPASLRSMPETVGFESDIKVSIAARVSAHMDTWAGFIKVGAGLVTKVSTTFPIEGEVSVDLKTGKIASTIKFPEEPVELLNLEMVPVTFTKRTPKELVPHQPDIKSSQGNDRYPKIVQFNRQPLANEEPNKFYSFQSDLLEQPFMLTEGYESTEFYRGLRVPVIESKEVPTQDALKTKWINLVLGHPGLGGVLEINGHVQMPYGVPVAPMVPLSGKKRLIVTLKPTNTGLRTVEVALYVRKDSYAGASKPNWSRLYDQMEGARASDILGRLESDLPRKWANDDKSGMSVQLVVRGKTESNEEVALRGVFSLVRGSDDKFIKVAAEFQSPHPQSPFQACLHGYASYPDSYDSDEITPGMNEPVTAQLEVAVGRSCHAPEAMKLKLKLVGDKSPEQVADEKNDHYSVEGSVIPVVMTKSVDPTIHMLKPIYQQCQNDRKRGLRWSDACETVKDVYSTLMRLKINVDYQNVPLQLEELLEKAERLVHSTYYWNSEVDSTRVTNAPNKISILADFTAGEEKIDLIYSTPKKDVKLFNIHAPYPLTPLSADEEPLSLEELLGEDLEDVCSVSGNRLSTLDDAEIRIPYSQCYHLLAKDCSEDEMWSVLFASAGTRSGDAKKIKVLIGNRKIELLPAELVSSRLRSVSDVVVKVDGRPIALDRENEEINIDEDISVELRKTPGQDSPLVVLKAEELGLELMFDGQNVALRPSFLLRDQICGLCGNDNGDDEDDMLLPNGRQAATIEDLIRGYTVQQGGCSADLSFFDSPRPENPEDRGCKGKTIVKYQAGEICFSVEPVQVASTQYELERQQDFVRMTRVGFHCLPEDSSFAQKLERDARTRVLREVVSKPVTHYFFVPEASSCRANERGSDSWRQSRREWF
jgi:hypothetical protein